MAFVRTGRKVKKEREGEGERRRTLRKRTYENFFGIVEEKVIATAKFSVQISFSPEDNKDL